MKLMVPLEQGLEPASAPRSAGLLGRTRITTQFFDHKNLPEITMSHVVCAIYVRFFERRGRTIVSAGRDRLQ